MEAEKTTSEQEREHAEKKLIAEFNNEGYWQIWRKNFYKPYCADRFSTKEECNKCIDNVFIGNLFKYKDEYESKFISPKYNSDWNSLMPVVKKILDIHTEKELKNCDGFYFPDEIIEGLRRVDIYMVFSNSWRFIEWYNKNKTK